LSSYGIVFVRKFGLNKKMRQPGSRNMRKPDEQRPCAMGRAVCGAAGLAGTLIRLTVGIVAVACLGYLAAGSIRKQEGKKKKMSLHPSRRGDGMHHKSAATRSSSGRQGAARENASRLSGRPAGRFPG